MIIWSSKFAGVIKRFFDVAATKTKYIPTKYQMIYTFYSQDKHKAK